jgi:hypothetical protein
MNTPYRLLNRRRTSLVFDVPSAAYDLVIPSDSYHRRNAYPFNLLDDIPAPLPFAAPSIGVCGRFKDGNS